MSRLLLSLLVSISCFSSSPGQCVSRSQETTKLFHRSGMRCLGGTTTRIRRCGQRVSLDTSPTDSLNTIVESPIHNQVSEMSWTLYPKEPSTESTCNGFQCQRTGHQESSGPLNLILGGQTSFQILVRDPDENVIAEILIREDDAIRPPQNRPQGDQQI